MTRLNRRGRKALGTPKSHAIRKWLRKSGHRLRDFTLCIPGPSTQPHEVFGPMTPPYDPRPVGKRNLEDVRKRFAGDVEEHVMEVLHEDGLYRHLRFKKPGTMMYHFDLITWPGYLTIQGDMGGGYTFSRERDMFPWFNSGPDINPDYWGQKLQQGSDSGARSVRTYNQEVLWEYLKDRYDDWVADNEVTAKDVEIGMSDHTELEAWIKDAEQVWTDVENHFSWRTDTEHEAMEALSDYKEDGRSNRIGLYDAWEWDLTDFDYHYLWACFAIRWGIKTYYDKGLAADVMLGRFGA